MRRLVYALVGCLALIGAVVVALNVGWNVGGISTCGTAKETALASVDGRFVLVIGISECGRSKRQTTARILSPAGETHMVFLGSAKSEEPILTAQWLGPAKLRLRYLASAQRDFPTGNLGGENWFGEVEVAYGPL